MSTGGMRPTSDTPVSAQEAFQMSRPPALLPRLLLPWFTANFLGVGLVSWLAGGWYLGWQPFWIGPLAELGLIMLPNFLFAVLSLRLGWFGPIRSLRQALGWEWTGWRAILSGGAGFGAYLLVGGLLSRWLGPGIPYNLPGAGAFSAAHLGEALALLLAIIVFIFVTVASEETMFRGLIQTQAGKAFGIWGGLGLTVLLFALRHLPADLFYARVWDATPRMWLARQADLWCGALLLSLARLVGRSTYASGLMHALLLIMALFG